MVRTAFFFALPPGMAASRPWGYSCGRRRGRRHRPPPPSARYVSAAGRRGGARHAPAAGLLAGSPRPGAATTASPGDAASRAVGGVGLATAANAGAPRGAMPAAAWPGAHPRLAGADWVPRALSTGGCRRSTVGALGDAPPRAVAAATRRSGGRRGGGRRGGGRRGGGGSATLAPPVIAGDATAGSCHMGHAGTSRRRRGDGQPRTLGRGVPHRHVPNLVNGRALPSRDPRAPTRCAQAPRLAGGPKPPPFTPRWCKGAPAQRSPSRGRPPPAPPPHGALCHRAWPVPRCGASRPLFPHRAGPPRPPPTRPEQDTCRRSLFARRLSRGPLTPPPSPPQPSL